MDDSSPEISEDTLNKYRLYVNNKFSISTDILNSNYYAHVFGQETQDQSLEDTVVFTDISSIFNQASVLYMYRNGFVDPESEDTFGGRALSKLGEFVDVMYRIAGRPETDNSALPEGYEDERFNGSVYEYYDAVCWAYQTGIVQSDDRHDGYNESVDYRTADLLIYRFAQYMGVDTAVDGEQVALYAEENPRLSEEVIRAILWADQENITTKDSDLEDIFDNYTTRLSRYQMTSFLFYLCTYELKLEG
jgi:hypothetical protein